MSEDNNELKAPQEQQPVEYTDDNIRHLSDMEHVRTRPGMYIGRLGDGNLPEDGIYVLLKEVVDNSIDEFKMGAGSRLEIDIEDHLRVSVRDYGRGIPQGKLVEAVSVLNTGGKYDSKAFKKSVGLNGVGVKAVNALSSHFEVKSFRDGKVRHLKFEKGILQSDVTEDTEDENGTFIFFEPDNTLFKNYSFHDDFVETMLRNYTYLNTGLTIMHNGRRILSRHGLKDLLTDNMTNEGLYEIVHMKGEDIEIAFTHTNQYGEEYYSFVNGQHTTQGGTHQSAFKEHIARTIKEFYGKYEYGDIRNGLVAAIALNVEEPVFESQTKIKLGSTTMSPNGGETINKYVGDFLKKEVDNYLHIHKDVAEILENKIKESERERKAMAAIVHDGKTGVQISIVAKHGFHDVVVEGIVLEEGVIRFEEDEGTILIFSILGNIALQDTFLKLQMAHLAVAERLYLEMGAEGVHRLHTHSVQAHTLLERLTVVFISGVQHAHRLNEFSLRNASTIVAHTDTQMVLDIDFDTGAGIHLEFVDGVIHHLLQEHINTIFRQVTITQTTDVHTRTGSHMLHIAQMSDIVVGISHRLLLLLLLLLRGIQFVIIF